MHCRSSLHSAPQTFHKPADSASRSSGYTSHPLEIPSASKKSLFYYYSSTFYAL
ncbi:hypothetical protein DM02DRAFT_693608 [Periconia macrospinosa]|uniref:Uncharacterized protein n=1 Tax=Periconia macrospinosa TaxID=97972 RepID=A0A2V1DAV0_9PLEO|nr:hypothetical protein DM02DRAFT_693608 [Periconia macrospinosa]